MNIRDYISIARPDHWVKHIFVVPGILCAVLLVPFETSSLLFSITVGFVSACLIASANYVINEWLDAEFDQHHYLKKQRPAAAGRLNKHLVYAEYALLTVVGLALAYVVSELFLVVTLLFWISGQMYNVRPFRTKERVFFDVLTEAVNNPIRLALGWAMVTPDSIPPLSMFVTYWFGGAFLMATKRLGEYRNVRQKQGVEKLAMYRASFSKYTEHSLLLSCFAYAILSIFFLAVFVERYRQEYILLFPLFAALFTYYLNLGLRDEAITQTPEKLYKDKGLVAIVGLLLVGGLLTSLIDFPVLSDFMHNPFVYEPMWK